MPWSGVVDDRHIGVARPVDKVAQRAAHLVDLEVAAEFDTVEVRRLERLRYQPRVIGGVTKPGHLVTA
jgi:hypothetical protein